MRGPHEAYGVASDRGRRRGATERTGYAPGPYIAAALAANDIEPDLFIEPFAGGASASLELLELGLLKRVALGDADPMVAAFCQTVFKDTDWLCRRVETVPLDLVDLGALQGRAVVLHLRQQQGLVNVNALDRIQRGLSDAGIERTLVRILTAILWSAHPAAGIRGARRRFAVGVASAG